MRNITFHMLLLLPIGNASAEKIVYLSCDIPAYPEYENPKAHFDFTLDEANGTVTYYVDKVDALNKEDAIFGPATVTWTNHLLNGHATLTRSINRTSLAFKEDFSIGEKNFHREGTCSVVKVPERKF